MSHPNLLNTSETVLLVIDVQDVLLKAIYEQERVVGNSVRLIEAAKILSLPILVTLQNAERFGDCNPSLTNAIPHAERFNKMTFSCLGSTEFTDKLKALNRKQVLICGVESHVCVNQTAHELLAEGYCVHIAKDAVSSRTPENWITGIEKMRDSGCVITSTEAAIFELVRDASKPEFKQILQLVK